MPTVVIYSRVSTLSQADDGVSLDAQVASGRAWCERNGHGEPHIETDEGLSGKRADNRPALQRALAKVCDERGILVVYSLSRLCRNTRDALDIAERIKKAGAHLVSLTENIDTHNALGEFFFTLMAALAQLERRLIGDRTREALAHKLASGEKRGGRVPFGYAAVDTGKRKADGEIVWSLVPSEDEQSVIRLILRECAGGRRFSACARLLNERGVPTRVGGRWKESVVSKIYRREAKQHAPA